MVKMKISYVCSLASLSDSAVCRWLLLVHYSFSSIFSSTILSLILFSVLSHFFHLCCFNLLLKLAIVTLGFLGPHQGSELPVSPQSTKSYFYWNVLFVTLVSIIVAFSLGILPVVFGHLKHSRPQFSHIKWEHWTPHMSLRVIHP